MNRTKIGIGLCVFVLAMVIVDGSQAALTIADYQLDLRGTDARTNRGRIAMKSTSQPVVALGTFDSGYYQVTEDLSNWDNRSEAWITGGGTALDITVDSSDNYHLAYAKKGKKPAYVDHLNNRMDLTADTTWTDGAGSVQIVANNDGVSVGWSPRTKWGTTLDGRNKQFIYQTLSGGSWSAATVLDFQGFDLSPRFLGTANEIYYYAKPDTDDEGLGPLYQQADDGVNNQIDLNTGLTRGVKMNDSHYDFYLSPAWNGSAMNLASVELAPGSSASTGLVALYLDIQGTLSEVVVFDDSAGGDGPAGSVALASVGGTNYVFFTAKDPLGTDNEVFVQAVDQNGSLLGSAQQLTDDEYWQSELDAVSYGTAADPHLHIVFNTNLVAFGNDGGERVSYMELTPEPTSLCLLLLGGVGLFRRRK